MPHVYKREMWCFFLIYNSQSWSSSVDNFEAWLLSFPPFKRNWVNISNWYTIYKEKRKVLVDWAMSNIIWQNKKPYLGFIFRKATWYKIYKSHKIYINQNRVTMSVYGSKLGIVREMLSVYRSKLNKTSKNQ